MINNFFGFLTMTHLLVYNNYFKYESAATFPVIYNYFKKIKKTYNMSNL